MTGAGRNARRAAAVSALVLAAAGLGACGVTPQGDLARAALRTKGPDVIQQGLANLEWTLCRATPVGAIIARYGDSQAKMDAWWTLCQGQRDVRFPAGREQGASAGDAGRGAGPMGLWPGPAPLP